MADPIQSPFPELDAFNDELKKLEEYATEDVELPSDEVHRGTFLPFTKNETTGDKDLAWPAALKGMWEAVELPGQVMRGEKTVDTSDPQFIAETTNLAMEMVGIGWAPKMAKPAVNSMRMSKSQTFPELSTTPVVKKAKDLDRTAPKGLETLETSGDLFFTYTVDEKSALSGLAERAGVPDFENVQKLIDLDTQAAAQMRIGEAIQSGRMQTFQGKFAAPESPEGLRRAFNSLQTGQREMIDEYLKLGDFMDDLEIRLQKDIEPAKTKKMLADAKARRQALIDGEPLVLEFEKRYQGITEAVRNFLAEGEYAMLDEKALLSLNTSRRNYVPIDKFGVDPNQSLLERIAEATSSDLQRNTEDWFLQSRDITSIEGIDNRTGAIDALLDYTKNALRYKMENDVRGSYIDGMRQSKYGKNTIVPLDPEDATGAVGRKVEVYRNGKKEGYVSSKLQAELLQFDPYIARYPLMYGAKRLFEMGTTGAASVTFAPTTMIRDGIAGMVFAPRGTAGPGLQTVVAPVRQAVAKVQRGMANVLENEFVNIPFLDNATRKAWASNLSDRYARSFYHLANEVGGFDASLMKSNIRIGRGALREMAHSWDEAVARHPALAAVKAPAALLQGFSRMYDAIQEAPRFATFINNVKKGTDPDEAIRLAKSLTGDTTRSGRVYRPDGQRIDADAIDKANKVFAPTAGVVTELLREGTPYFNPTVQGLRRLADRMIDDPAGTSAKAWLYVGMPTMAAEMWNSMLGEEYTEFAHNGRTDRDQTMNMYFGMPGKDPRYGIEIPLPHELTIWSAPFSRLAGEMNRSDPEVGGAFFDAVGNVVENAGMLGYPILGSQLFAATGNTSPDSIMNPFQSVYERREDHSSFLPENVEMMLRQAFGGITNANIMALSALYEGGPTAMGEEFIHQLARKTPVVKNVLGKKVRSTAFTPNWEERSEKLDAYREFFDAWNVHFNPKRAGNRLRSSKMASTKGLFDPTSTVAVAPSPIARPTNPLYPTVGMILVDRIGRNEDGMTGLAANYSTLTKQLKRLKRYTAGNKNEYVEFAKWFDTIDQREEETLQQLGEDASEKELNKARIYYEEERKIKKILDELDVDFNDRDDVLKLVDYFERQRGQVLQEQLSLIEKVEDDITTMLHQQGMLPKGEKFSIEKHMKPY